MAKKKSIKSVTKHLLGRTLKEYASCNTERGGASGWGDSYIITEANVNEEKECVFFYGEPTKDGTWNTEYRQSSTTEEYDFNEDVLGSFDFSYYDARKLAEEGYVETHDFLNDLAYVIVDEADDEVKQYIGSLIGKYVKVTSNGEKMKYEVIDAYSFGDGKNIILRLQYKPNIFNCIFLTPEQAATLIAKQVVTAPSPVLSYGTVSEPENTCGDDEIKIFKRSKFIKAILRYKYNIESWWINIKLRIRATF